jgi:hypothetical protein
MLNQSGTVIGLNCRGDMTLATHEPIAELDLGFAAKVDLSKIRASFVTAGAIIAGI